MLPNLEAQPIITAIETIVASERREERTHSQTRNSRQYSWQQRAGTGADRHDDRGHESHDSEGRDHKASGTGETSGLGPGLLDESAVELGKRTVGQRNADALLTLFTQTSKTSSPAGKPKVVITVTETELHNRAAKAGLIRSTGGLHGATPLAASELRRLCCDSEIMPLVLGTKSEILDAGRTRRLVTPEIRRVLSLRDGGCKFPNCEKPDAACEAHHIIPWQEGGPTALENLVLLCPYHHRIIEPDNRPEGQRWRVTIDPETRRPVFTPPEQIQTGNSPPA
ncbi:MAG: hypothetical protein CSA63_01925 [Propionibacterium sp.]|nr:MAG: hypothetical protein CSA63_01925 [Propionibacterium sp.]